MTRNNTLNKVHVAATEPPQLLSQNTDMFGEATGQSHVRLRAALKLTENKYQLSPTNSRDALYHGECATNKGGRSM